MYIYVCVCHFSVFSMMQEDLASQEVVENMMCRWATQNTSIILKTALDVG